MEDRLSLSLVARCLSPPLGSSSTQNFLDLRSLPPIYVLPIRLSTDELHDVEDQIQDLHGDLTYDIREAKIVLGNIKTKTKAELELRFRKLYTEEVPRSLSGLSEHELCTFKPPRKRQKTSNTGEGSTIEDEDTNENQANRPPVETTSNSKASQIASEDSGGNWSEVTDLTQAEPSSQSGELRDTVRVVRLQWLTDSIHENRLLGIENYIVYEGRSKASSIAPTTPPRKLNVKINTSPREGPRSQQVLAERPNGFEILERARADASYAVSQTQDPHTMAAPHGARKMGRASGGRHNFRRPEPPKQPIRLMEMSTDGFEDSSDKEMPPPPDWVQQHVLYACQRAAPMNPPNEDFINELKKIRLARTLTNDEIGVRAYSTSIASLAAYPYKVVNPREILRLPGCDTKIANLWIEWKNNGGKIKAAEEAENDESLQKLNLFYEIWGVGATTAREFYFDKGWNDLDDIIEFGWKDLSRVQQIGVKYYEEFQQKIPRPEVEFIAEKVREHAVKVRDDGIELIVVGGYRRGKIESGDVDMIVSHRHLEKTAGLVQDIVESLERENWITHTLTLSLKSTHRNQSTLPFKTSAPAHGAGFDTLDKALVVWQDPNWSTMEEDLKSDGEAKNPNIHRRVDIIVSPWRTVGCAVLGWTSGTTFQRDLRRYARNVKGWKFDSSGVRDRSAGEVVELEGPNGVSGSMVDAEKKVFEGFGLTYREPWDRCTG